MAEEPIVRQFVNFSFYRLNPEWRKLHSKVRQEGEQEFGRLMEDYSKRMIIRLYSLQGIRADCEFMIWRISERLEDFQEMSTKLHLTAFGQHWKPVYSYLAMTKRSSYIDKISPEHGESRTRVVPGKYKYIFVYPFVKTRQWYLLSAPERQALMDEHIAIGTRYPSVKLNTTYSFGLDDQEFVVAFETDNPADFLDLVMELRHSKASGYTLRDTPTFTCVAKSLKEILDSY